MSALTDITSVFFERIEDFDGFDTLTAAQMHKSFKESEHPRDPSDGKFVKKGFGVGKVAQTAKPIKINTKVIYNTQYADGQVVAVKSLGDGTQQQLIWDAGKKKFTLQEAFSDGKVIVSLDDYGKGEAYKKFKLETGWTEPKTPVGAITRSDDDDDDDDDVDQWLPAFDSMDPDEIAGWFSALTVANWNAFTDKQKNVIEEVALAEAAYGTNLPKNDLAALKKKAALITPGAGLPVLHLMTDGEAALWLSEFTQEAWDALTPDEKSAVGAHFGDLGLPWAIKKINDFGGVTDLDDDYDGGDGDAWPTPSDLKFTGKVLGTHGAKVYRDVGTGKEYLFKPTPSQLDFTVEADLAVSKLQKKFGIPGPEIRSATIDGDYGSLQEMIPSTPAFPGHFKPVDHGQKTHVKLLQHQVFDWLISQHDSHAANFIRDKNGDLVAIDKTQAFKFFPFDRLAVHFQPNEHPTVYSTLWKAYEKGDIDLPAPTEGQLHTFIQAIQSMPDATLISLLTAYADAAAKRGKLMDPKQPKSGPSQLGSVPADLKQNDVIDFMKRVIARKNSLLADFTKLYNTSTEERNKTLIPKPLVKSPATSAPTPPSVLPSPATPKTTSAPKPKPMKITTTVIYKTEYEHGAVVAQKPNYATISGLGERLVWNGPLKKFFLQTQTVDGNWINNVSLAKFSFGKGEAFKTFKDQPGWFTPDPGSSALGSGGIWGSQGPKVSGSPTADDVKIATDPDAGKFSKFDADSLIQLHGDVPGQLMMGQKEKLWHSFKTGANDTHGLGQITLKSKPNSIFIALVNAVTEFNKTSTNGVNLNYLQALKFIDENGTPAGKTNEHKYEKLIVDWLKTSDGKAYAPMIIHNASLPKTTGASLSTAKLAELKTPSDIGKPHTDATTTFPILSLQGASAMHTKMRAKYGDWTGAQRKAIKNYTGSGYGSMNTMLRKGAKTGSSVKTAEEIVDMQTGMHPVLQDFVVHRGTVLEQFGVTTSAKLKKLVGATVTDKGFVSTSVGGAAAFSSNPVIVEIEVPKGTPGAYVKSISLHPNENEFILAAGTKFKILSVTGNHVRMRVIP